MSNCMPAISREKTYGEPESKIEDCSDPDLVSDGVSEDSNLEALVSVSSVNKQTPTSLKSEFNLSSKDKNSSVEMIFLESHPSPNQAEVDSGTPRGLYEFRKDQA